jgi:hypothetical protein
MFDKARAAAKPSHIADKHTQVGFSEGKRFDETGKFKLNVPPI